MTYYLKWKGEIIESEIATLEEAEFLQGEYQLAYGGYVEIKKERRNPRTQIAREME